MLSATSLSAITKSRHPLSAFADWFVVSPGHIDLIRRLCGLAGILMGGLSFTIFRTLSFQYVVPAWRYQSHLFVLPTLPSALCAILWGIHFLSCLCLFLGFRNRIFVAIPLCTMLYFGCTETTTCAMHWTICLFCFLTALLFDTPGRSVTRRLIQLATAMCYGYSALQKIVSPDFASGETLAAYARHAEAIQPFWLHLIHRCNPEPSVFWALAWGTIAIESFLCFGLFFKTTRKFALVIGLAFHATISLVMHIKISLFTLIMAIGYLSFFEKENEKAGMSLTPSKSDWVAHHKLRIAAAALTAIVWLLIPLRIYFGERPNTELTTQDRRPWTFEMFDVLNEPAYISIEYTDAQGASHYVRPRGRMLITMGDNDLYALSQYIRRSHPEARKVAINVMIYINRKWWLQKNLTQERGRDLITAKRFPAVDASRIALRFPQAEM